MLFNETQETTAHINASTQTDTHFYLRIQQRSQNNSITLNSNHDNRNIEVLSLLAGPVFQ